MTITLDIKEILEYEKAMLSWGTDRAMNIEKIMASYNDISNPMAPGGVGIRRAIVTWDNNNPPPKLIPVV